MLKKCLLKLYLKFIEFCKSLLQSLGTDLQNENTNDCLTKKVYIFGISGQRYFRKIIIKMGPESEYRLRNCDPYVIGYSKKEKKQQFN